MKLLKLKKKREESGFTQKEIAEILGISVRTYMNYEQGIRTIKIPILKQLSLLFKCTMNDLI